MHRYKWLFSVVRPQPGTFSDQRIVESEIRSTLCDRHVVLLHSGINILSSWIESLCHVFHDDVSKWKHVLRYWPFVREIHRSPVNSPHKGQWRGALMFSLICALINDWVNNHEAGDLRRHRAHYDDIAVLRIFGIKTPWLGNTFSSIRLWPVCVGNPPLTIRRPVESPQKGQ